jgi:CelD/BcsL family acetyltransferase involved in cellulose biosynthesis
MGNTDYMDMLLAPGREEIILQEIFNLLYESRARWDYCEFESLIVGSALCAFRVPGPLISKKVQQDTCPVLRLPGTPEEFRKSLNPAFRDRLKRAARKLNRMGEIRFQMADGSSWPELMEMLFELHGKRWKEGGSALSGEIIRSFHLAAARGMSGQGSLRLYALKLEERTLSVLYTFASGRRVYCYLDGFEPEFAELSPGTLLINHAIGDAIKSGFGEFDFLRGAERHKYRWGAGDSFTSRLYVWHPGSKNLPPQFSE